jgi:uncharacterized DUF497 family protein
MERTFDCNRSKREKLWAERRINLLSMGAVFRDEKRVEFVDARREYGEERRVTIGRVRGQLFTVVYTIRGNVTWLITAWPSSRKERARHG